MFGLENVDQATKWLQVDPVRRIEISHPANGFVVDFVSADIVVTGTGEKLMDALKAGLAGLPKA